MNRIGDKNRTAIRLCSFLWVMAVSIAATAPALAEYQRAPDTVAPDKVQRSAIPDSQPTANAATWRSPLSQMGFAQIVPTVSLFNPSSFVLKNNNHEVSYSDKVFGLPSLSVALNHPLGHIDRVEFTGLLSLGYGYKSMVPSVTYRSGTTQTENLAFHRFPLTAAIRTLYEFSNFTGVRPGLLLGVSAEGIVQRGDTAQLNQFYLVPNLLCGFSLSFLDSRRTPDDWFGGFSFDTILQTSVGRQNINGISFNFGFNILI